MIVTQFSAGPTLGSTLIRSVVDSIDERFVVVQYLPISRVLSDTEYKASLRSMQLVVQLTKPRMILSLDDDYMKYMPPNIYDVYRDKFYIANKGLATVGRPSCELIDLISKRTHQPDAPVYILRDDNVAHIESARALGSCLKDLNHDVSYFSASTVADLKADLFDIDTKDKGILISLVNTVNDTEFNKPVGLDAINRLIRTINRTHLDIGFVRANKNLSLVIVPTVGGLDPNEKTWANMRTTPKLYVLVDRLDKLGGSLVYKNMFAEISGVLEE
ncbi:hypothetical protein pEaSNUABM22_00103 [Erwinia phage pEa_SNUABM_22]|uniref:Uncharacterized protein n=1 Tax=Erwinia phage pEa_SNUABM_22 TaxID=2869549 RepID=A0AAE8XRM8_9CAUD|nr:hypothetical protein MPK63_gp103 [Erwinia phage pEa_SNUABM_22]UAW96591.1 hypothetical protein pEaSNUABM22_00103 [Erwinia phage pEa_SNUABM_22]